MTEELKENNVEEVSLIDPDDETRKWKLTIAKDGKILKMVDNKE